MHNNLAHFFSRNVRVNAFRALGTICCVLEGIMELQECGGVELLARTLGNANLINDNAKSSVRNNQIHEKRNFISRNIKFDVVLVFIKYKNTKKTITNVYIYL